MGYYLPADLYLNMRFAATANLLRLRHRRTMRKLCRLNYYYDHHHFVIAIDSFYVEIQWISGSLTLTMIEECGRRHFDKVGVCRALQMESNSGKGGLTETSFR